jgi:hypothetical protein
LEDQSSKSVAASENAIEVVSLTNLAGASTTGGRGIGSADLRPGHVSSPPDPGTGRYRLYWQLARCLRREGEYCANPE